MKTIKPLKVFFMVFTIFVLYYSCLSKKEDKSIQSSNKSTTRSKSTDYQMKHSKIDRKKTKPLIDVYCDSSKPDESIGGSLEIKGVERVDTRVFNLDVQNGISLKTTATYIASNLAGDCISIQTVASSIEGVINLQGWIPDDAIDDPYVLYDSSTNRVSIQIDGDYKSGIGAFSEQDPSKVEHYSIVLCYNLYTGAYKSGGIIKTY